MLNSKIKKKSIFFLFNVILLIIFLGFNLSNYVDPKNLLFILILMLITDFLLLLSIFSKKTFGEIFDLLTFLTNFSIFLMIIVTFVVFTSKVDGSSMEPTLKNHKRVYIYKIRNDVKVDNVVVYKDTFNDVFIVKRVVAIKDDIISVAYNEENKPYILINDVEYRNKYDERYYMDLKGKLYLAIKDEPYKVLEDEFLLLGDNEELSRDGRHIGISSYKYLIGKVIGDFKWIKIQDTNK